MNTYTCVSIILCGKCSIYGVTNCTSRQKFHHKLPTPLIVSYTNAYTQLLQNTLLLLIPFISTKYPRQNLAQVKLFNRYPVTFRNILHTVLGVVHYIYVHVVITHTEVCCYVTRPIKCRDKIIIKAANLIKYVWLQSLHILQLKSPLCCLNLD